jgi:hypothetical protein
MGENLRYGIAAVMVSTTLFAQNDTSFERDLRTLKAYRAEISQLRKTGRPSFGMPGPNFFLFGMGSRQKILYRNGELIEWPSNRVARKWKVEQETIVPPAYSVWLRTAGSTVHIFENESGLFLEENGKRTTLSTVPVRLPEFTGERFPNILRALHQEILINILEGKPVPNFLVYPKPWYRDSAMTAMVLRRTGNIGLIREWIMSLRDPFDHNNGGGNEADNLGEVLYLISCVSDRGHPLVSSTVKEIDRFKKGDYIVGSTDFAEHPVYQTKWLKFGLKGLGLPDQAFVVPQMKDSYASLFWWDFKDGQIGPEFSLHDAQYYPYLAWARDHLDGGHTGPVTAGDHPLSWEAYASGADYKGMSVVSADFTNGKVAAPHTWHAAEMFLALASDKAAF